MSKIEWTEKTWNPVKARLLGSGKVGNYCEKISAGCKHCYAEAINRRGMEPSGNGLFYIVENRPKVEIFLDEDILMQPIQRRKPTTYFPGSMTDLFGDWVTDEMLDRIFAVMALCPQHAFQCLTKRPGPMREYLNSPGRKDAISAQMWEISKHRTDHMRGGWPLDHVWLGVSCENQEQADKRIPELLQTPAAVRFLSCEPLLGPIDLEYPKSIWPDGPPYCCPGTVLDECGCQGLPIDPPLIYGIDWVIVGGESGHGARPCGVPWVQSLVRQCAEANVACFVKQLGAKSFGFGYITPLSFKNPKGGDMAEWPEELRVRQMPKQACESVA